MVVRTVNQYFSPDILREITLNSARKLGYQQPEGAVKDNEDIAVNGRIYRITKFHDRQHKWGSGGFDQDLARLVRINGTEDKIIESEDYHAWSTTFDDSTDYDDGERVATTLVIEDSLGNLVFEEIERLSKERKEKVEKK